MKKNILIIGLLSILSSCINDIARLDVTYTRATAIYADLDEIRNTPLVSTSKEISNPGKIFVSETLLLVGEEGEGIHIIDNTDPELPRPKFFINVPGNREFFVSEGKLFAESYYDMLMIDITNIDQPVLLSRVQEAFGPELKNNLGESIIGFETREVTESLSKDDDLYDIVHSANTLYYDFENRLIPESAVPASFAGSSDTAIGTVNRIAANDGHVYVVSKHILTTFRIDDGLELVNSQQIGWNMETVFPHNGNLFVGTQNSMEVLSLANPEQPSHLTSFFHANSCDPVYPVENTAYVTLRTGDIGQCPGDINALLVLDISTIANPVQMQELPMESAFGMTMIGNLLFVGEGAHGLKVFDATNRHNLLLEKWDETISAYDIIPHPTRQDIVLIAGPDGLSQYGLGTDTALSHLSTVFF
ncbi:MAG: hypothetical protein RJQ09_04750 [Cyclobacteriaceae bacterium]